MLNMIRFSDADILFGLRLGWFGLQLFTYPTLLVILGILLRFSCLSV